MQQNKIDYLIVKLFSNSLTETETAELEEWLSKEKNQEYFNKYVELNYLLLNQQKFDNSESFKKVRRKILNKSIMSTLIRMAAVLAIVAGIGIITYSYFNTKTEYISQSVNNIEPGSDKAILILEDGREITLDTQENFILENILIKTGKLTYGNTATETENIAYNYLKVPKGGQFSIELTDGTEISLNASSLLKFPVQFIKGQSREVELVYGEAYFNVKRKGKNLVENFIVKTDYMDIEVLGTQFNVKAYPEDCEVITTLIEGAIKLNHKEKQINLEPNNQAVINKSSEAIVVEEVIAPSKSLWKNGVFSFEDKSLGDIMIVLERWYDMDVKFEDQNLKNERFTGVVSRTQPIEEIMQILYQTNGIEYQIKENSLIIK